MSNPLKKTMVFLGLAEEDLEERATEDVTSATHAMPAAPSAARTPAPRQPQAKAAVTPLRRVTPTQPVAAHAISEILTVHPAEYREAKAIAEAFRDGIPVIMNLSRMTENEAKRMVDFASGLTMGLNGRIERVTGKVFLLSPEHIEIGGDHGTQHSDSFFVAPTA